LLGELLTREDQPLLDVAPALSFLLRPISRALSAKAPA
jgi:hypothetical protein